MPLRSAVECNPESGDSASHTRPGAQTVHLGTYLNRLWERVYPAIRSRPGGEPQGKRECERTPAHACVLLERMIERGNRWRGGLPRIERGGTLWLSNSQLEQIAPNFSARQSCDLLDYLARVGLVAVEMRGMGRARERHVTLMLGEIADAPRLVGGDDKRGEPENAAPRQTLAPRRRDTVAPLPSPVSTACRSTGPDERLVEKGGGPEAGQPASVPELSPEEREAAGPAIRAYQSHQRCPERNREGYPVRTDRDREAAHAAAAAAAAGAPPAQVAETVRAHLTDYRPENDRRRSPFVKTFGWCLPALADLAERAQRRPRRAPAPRAPEPRDDAADAVQREALNATAGLNLAELRQRLDAAGIAHDATGSAYALRHQLVAAVAEGMA